MTNGGRIDTGVQEPMIHSSTDDLKAETEELAFDAVGNALEEANQSLPNPDASELALSATADIISHANEVSAETHEASSLSNKAGVLDELGIRRVEGSEILVNYIDKTPDQLSPSIKLGLMQVIKRFESNQVLANRITSAENIFAIEADANRIGPVEPQPDLDAANELLGFFLTQLNAYQEQLNTSRSGIGETIEAVEGAVVSRGMDLREHLHRMSPTHRAAFYGTMIVAALYAYNNSSDKAKAIRKVVSSLAIWGVAVPYAANVLVEAATGSSLLEGLEWLNGTRGNRHIAEYFSLNYDDENEKKYTEGLLESMLYDEEIGRNRTFSQIINAYHQNSEAQLMPNELVMNSESFNSQEGRRILFHSVGIMVDKYGPDSVLYRTNPQVKEVWDRLISSASPWQQGLDLLLADPASPEILYGNWLTSANHFFQERIITPSGELIHFGMDKFREVAADHPNYQAYLAGLEALFPESITDEATNQMLNKSISTLDQMDSFAGGYGSFAHEAFTVPESMVYQDASGTAYTLVELPISETDFVNTVFRHSLILQAYVKAGDWFAQSVNHENGRDVPDLDLTSNINLLFGAEMRHTDGNGGKYYVAFSYLPNESPLRELVDFANPSGLDEHEAETNFNFEALNPIQKLTAMAKYQGDAEQTERRVSFAMELLERNDPTKFSTGTVHEKLEYLMDDTTIHAVFEGLHLDYNESCQTLYYDLNEIIDDYADRLADPSKRGLFIDSLAALHMEYTVSAFDTDFQSRLGLGSNEPDEIKTKFEDAIRLFIQTPGDTSTYNNPWDFTSMAQTSMVDGWDSRRSFVADADK